MISMFVSVIAKLQLGHIQYSNNSCHCQNWWLMQHELCKAKLVENVKGISMYSHVSSCFKYWLYLMSFSTNLQSKRKATDTEEEDELSEKKYRRCEKSGCSATYPVCFASASDRYNEQQQRLPSQIYFNIVSNYSNCLVSGVLKMDTHRAGIIFHVANTSAMSALITITEGKRTHCIKTN